MGVDTQFQTLHSIFRWGSYGNDKVTFRDVVDTAELVYRVDGLVGMDPYVQATRLRLLLWAFWGNKRDGVAETAG